MKRTTRFIAFAMLALAVSACSRSRIPANQDTSAPTTLRVENQGFLDMVIYIVPSGGARFRLGTAGGNSTTRLRIPSSYIFGATNLQFLADPVGGRRTPVSNGIMVSPGDEVTLYIPPGS